MLNIDLGKIVIALGEDTIADIGAPLGLSKELSFKAARPLITSTATATRRLPPPPRKPGSARKSSKQ